MPPKSKAKKRWYEIVAPKIFGKQVLGETLALEEELLVGRPLNLNLMELTRDIKKQHVRIGFVLGSVNDGKAQAEVVSYSLVPGTLKRQVRRRRDKLSDSFLCKTKDGKVVRIKPVVITSSNAKGGVLTDLRKQIRNLISGAVNKTPFETLINDLVTQKLQFYLRDKLRALYPIRHCDIMYFGIDDGKGTVLVSRDKAYTSAKGKSRKKKVKPEETAEIAEASS